MNRFEYLDGVTRHTTVIKFEDVTRTVGAVDENSLFVFTGTIGHLLDREQEVRFTNEYKLWQAKEGQ